MKRSFVEKMYRQSPLPMHIGRSWRPGFTAKKTEEGGQEHIIRTRNEAIQHAKALRYITEAVITREEDFSKELIINTHRILCQEVNHPKHKAPWRSCAGIYQSKVKQPFTGGMGRRNPRRRHSFYPVEESSGRDERTSSSI